MGWFLMPRTLPMDEGATLVAGEFSDGGWPWEIIYTGYAIDVGSLSPTDFSPLSGHNINELLQFHQTNTAEHIYDLGLYVGPNSGAVVPPNSGWISMTISGPSGSATFNRADADSFDNGGVGGAFRGWLWPLTGPAMVDGETYQITFE